MLQADPSHRVISVTDAGGAPITGLTIANFTVTAYGRGYGASAWTTYLHGATLTEIGGGDYALAFVAPPSAGWMSVTVRPVSATHTVWNARWEGEIESHDLDSIAVSIAVAGPVSPPANVLLGWTYYGALVAYRYNRWALPILDATGAAVDISTYGNLKLSVRSLDQTTRKLDAFNGTPTGFVLQGTLGLLTIHWPETTGAGVADIYAHIPAGAISADAPLYYEVTGDEGGDASKTVPIIRSSVLEITRREVGS